MTIPEVRFTTHNRDIKDSLQGYLEKAGVDFEVSSAYYNGTQAYDFGIKDVTEKDVRKINNYIQRLY